ncbi:MAG: class II aldolase/adducin family protein [Pseudomonadota bacterium]
MMTTIKMHSELLTPNFLSLSAKLGQDPLQVQGAGGNTSIKNTDVMWIKASGTQLAHAQDQDIFIPVSRAAAVAQLMDEENHGQTVILDPSSSLRPSIEMTFHAALDYPVVIHTHSVNTLVHAISPQGLAACQEKLAGLSFALVPYVKPGLPLTKEIMAHVNPATNVIVLQNHGLICCGASVQEVADLLNKVEERLAMPPRKITPEIINEKPPTGFAWAQEGWIAHDSRAYGHATNGSYYPDHVVFLGPALPGRDHDNKPPAIIHKDKGVALRHEATAAQKAMLRCLADVLSRLPDEWDTTPIRAEAEAELLNWDAEKYRQALARGS